MKWTRLAPISRGDPAAALLEILDPAQNNNFRDNYLDLPFDLSKVLFITTANTLDTIARPLLDRMETLRLSGYSEEEEAVIARRFLIPRRLEEAGLNDMQLQIPDRHPEASDLTLHPMKPEYRRDREIIGRLASRIARRFAEGNTTPFLVPKRKPQRASGARNAFIPKR